jgi:hypothetical protein
MSDAVQIALIAAIPGSIAAIAGIMNHFKIEVVRKDVNGKMQQLLNVTGDAREAKGNLAGNLEGRAEAKAEAGNDASSTK